MRTLVWGCGAAVICVSAIATAFAASEQFNHATLAVIGYVSDPAAFLAIGVGLLGLARRRRVS